MPGRFATGQQNGHFHFKLTMRVEHDDIWEKDAERGNPDDADDEPRTTNRRLELKWVTDGIETLD